MHPVCCNPYIVEEKFILTEILEKPRRSDHFPEWTENPPWFFIMSAVTILKRAFRLSLPYIKKKKKKRSTKTVLRATTINKTAFP